MEIDDSFFMNLALKEAWKYQLLTYPNPAVGAVVLENKKILAIQAHQKAGNSHAEVLALLKAYEVKSKKKIDFNRNDAKLAHKFLLSLERDFFKDFEIFITLEPCSHAGKTPSCALLLSKIKPKRVVIGAIDPISSHSGGVKILKEAKILTKLLLLQEAKDLLEPFKIWQKRAFVIFKLAQSLNGKIGGGYLSSKESLIHVHKIREVIDKLIIGGNTVRVDRPKLDCRFINSKKAPDIIIFSKEKEFDKTIPLFNVSERKVEITQNLDEIFAKPSLLLVEGGGNTLKALREKLDWFLLYLTPKLSENEISYNLDQNIRFLHQEKIGKDLLIWSRFE
jgi:diaminohydroxyphosphoribosylaminopyrimidine deaminase/5-amino-6-(5-phosphoribosylamino)uracil reductase